MVRLVESVADLLESARVDLLGRGFRRVFRGGLGWEKPISDDIVWRITLDDVHTLGIYAGVGVRFFAGYRPFTTLIRPPYDWDQELVRNPSDTRGLVAQSFHPKTGLHRLPSSHSESQSHLLARIIEHDALPYLGQYTTVEAVLDGVLRRNSEPSTRRGRSASRYFSLCHAALLRWRLGAARRAIADLDLAEASIVRIDASSPILWPPTDWLTREIDPELERFAEEIYNEQKSFVRDLRSFVQNSDPTLPVPGLRRWPDLDGDIVWRAGTWRSPSDEQDWEEPTLQVSVPTQRGVRVRFSSASGRGEAWLGPGPAYFDDDPSYDEQVIAEGLAGWSASATGAQPEISVLNVLIAPSWTIDPVEGMTAMCDLLAVGLPTP